MIYDLLKLLLCLLLSHASTNRAGDRAVGEQQAARAIRIDRVRLFAACALPTSILLALDVALYRDGGGCLLALLCPRQQGCGLLFRCLKVLAFHCKFSILQVILDVRKQVIPLPHKHIIHCITSGGEIPSTRSGCHARRWGALPGCAPVRPDAPTR